MDENFLLKEYLKMDNMLPHLLLDMLVLLPGEDGCMK